MRAVTRSCRPADELKEELAIGAAIRLRVDSDDIREVVGAVVEYLIENYPRQDIYIPAGGCRLPKDEIRADLDAGMSMRQLCSKYRADRRTIYRALDEA